jgi:hypothetical protein
LLFGDSGLVIYSSNHVPDELDIRLWVIESDADVCDFALEADKVLDSDAFKGMFAAVEIALAVTAPALSGAIAVGGVAVSLLRQKLRANKDNLVGYRQISLNRTERATVRTSMTQPGISWWTIRCSDLKIPFEQ